MASVTEVGCWIHDGADLADYVMAASRALTAGGAVDGTVETYAGGFRRFEATPAIADVWDITLRTFNVDTVAWIVAHRGDTVMIRNLRFGKIWGVYTSATTVPIEGVAGWDITLHVESTSTSESA